MKLICDCGAVTEFVQNEDSTYTEGEGWYVRTEGDVELYGEHDQVFMKCNSCGKEIWMFT